MIEKLDPIAGLRHALARSRLLRVTFIVGIMTLAGLLAQTLRGRIDPAIAGILALLDVGVWYFGLAAAAGFRTWQALRGEVAGGGIAGSIDLAARLVIAAMQVLLLAMVMILSGG